MVDPFSVRFKGPLASHVRGLWSELLGLGYTPLSARDLLRLAAHLSRWMAGARLEPGDLTQDRVAEFVRHRRHQGHTGCRSERSLQPLLGHLRSVGVVPAARVVPSDAPVDVFVREYAQYLGRERGLGPRAIVQYAGFARRFAAERPRLEWARLTAADVTAFVVEESRRSRIGVAKNSVTYLRSLLRFLHVGGRIDRDLASCVPSPAGWRLAGLPKAIEPDQVDRLLRSFDLASAVGRRDAAIVRLLLRLGLRAREVATLELDDVDWRAGELLVHGKGGREARLPLPRDVGRAVAAYLRRGRPRGRCRSVFLRCRAPYPALTAGSVISLASRALRRTGIAAGGAHLLRHTAATQMLRGGASLPEIGHVLRHRHVDTTAIYAKVDYAALRALAQPWPGGEA